MPPVNHNPLSMPVDSILHGCKDLMDLVAKNQTQAIVLKRKIACLNDQLELAKERTDLLAGKVTSGHSFRARYEELKKITQSIAGEEKYKKIHAKVHAAAGESTRASKLAAEKDSQDYEARQDALVTKCQEEVTTLKKEGTDRLAAWANFCDLAAVLGNKKGRKGAVASGAKPKRTATPSAYSRFIGDKSVRARFDQQVKDGETDLDWFKWTSAEWKTYSVEQKKPYQDEADAAKAAKANGEAPPSKTNGEADASDGAPKPKKAKTVGASPAAATPAEEGKKKPNKIAEAFAKGKPKSEAGPSGSKARKLPADSDDDEPAKGDDDDDEEEFGGRGAMAAAKAKAQRKRKAGGNAFIDDEAEEADGDEGEEEDNGEMDGFIVPDDDDDEGEEGDEEEVAAAESDDDDDEQ